MSKTLTIIICMYLFIRFMHSSNIHQNQKYEEHDTDVILISSVDEITTSKPFKNFPQDVHVIIVVWPLIKSGDVETIKNLTLQPHFPSWLDYELYDLNSAESFIQTISPELNDFINLDGWDLFSITAFAHLISEKKYLCLYIGSQLLSEDLSNYPFRLSQGRKTKRESFLEVLLSQQKQNTIGAWEQMWMYRFGDPNLNCMAHSPADQTDLDTDRCIPRGLPKALRSSISPASATDTTCAIFTMVRNEAHFLPIWIRYYSRHVRLEDMWVLDHYTTDNSTHPSKLPKGLRYKKILGEDSYAPFYFMYMNFEFHMQRLLRAGYSCLLYTDVDEIIAPDPNIYRGGLGEYLRAFKDNQARKYSRVTGVQLAHASIGTGYPKLKKCDDETQNCKNPSSESLSVDESNVPESPDSFAIDWSLPILKQRRYWGRYDLFDKPTLSKVLLRVLPGFHNAVNADNQTIVLDPTLILIHLHYLDRDYCLQRESWKFQKTIDNWNQRQNNQTNDDIYSTYDMKLGLNRLAPYSFDQIKLDLGVCGHAHAQIKEDGLYAVLPNGRELDRIPDNWIELIDI